MKKSISIVRPSDLAEALGVARATIWRMEKRGDLPPRIKVSPRCTGWIEEELEEFFKSRPRVDLQNTQEV